MPTCLDLVDTTTTNGVVSDTTCGKDDATSFLVDNINGYWVEDEGKRQNLSNFLSAMNTMYWAERKVATSTTWKNSQTMMVKDGTFKVHGIRGPLKDAFEFSLKLDNQTMEKVDMGKLGGWTDATAAIKDGWLINYFRKKGTNEVYLTAEHTVTRDQPNIMVIKVTNVKSGQAVTHHFDRQ